MSQQTTMAVVVPRFEAFIERLPTLADLATVGDDVLRELWAGLGYYARARNLRAGASYIVSQRGGEFPSSYEDWLKVPGVGPYTASVISSICFLQPKACVDGNVVRVVARLAACHGTELWSDDGRTAIQNLVDTVILKERPGDFNQAMMELGATLCQKKSPDCGRCPVSSSCQAFALSQVEQCPPNKPRKDFVDVELLALHLWRASVESHGYSELFLAERRSGFLAGTVGFPLLRCEPGKTPENYLEQFSKSSFFRCVKLEKVKISHTITHHKLSLNVVTLELGDSYTLHEALDPSLVHLLNQLSISLNRPLWVSKNHASRSVASSLDRKIWEKIS
ncbi:MAG: A/G-specific adenine glycosylase [Betaproteobacteria bacterium]|nr:A/G-specific adenine glycosylase [Betaproteobacteria bacterium]